MVSVQEEARPKKKKEPSVRKSGLCYVCKKVPLSKVALQNNDPFCSTDCCRAYYEVGRNS